MTPFEKAREALEGLQKQQARLAELGPREYIRELFELPSAAERQAASRRVRLQRLRDREAAQWALREEARARQDRLEAALETEMLRARLERGRAIFPGE